MKKLTSLILIGFVAVNFTFAQDADSKSEKKNETAHQNRQAQREKLHFRIQMRRRQSFTQQPCRT